MISYALYFSILSLSAWMIAFNLKAGRKFTSILFILSMVVLLINDLFFSWNFTLGLFHLAKDLLILGAAGAIMLVARKNVFAQMGILALGGYYLFSMIPDTHDAAQYNIDKNWELIVKLNDPGNDDFFKKYVDKYSLTTEAIKPNNYLNTELDNYFYVGIPKAEEINTENIYYQLGQLDEVAWIEYNEKILRVDPTPTLPTRQKPISVVNDPLLAEQWSMQALHMQDYYQYFIDNNIKPVRKAKLFILDSGVDAEHEDLRQSYKSDKAKYDRDVSSHGTHCAGIAAAHTNNHKGIASLSPGPDWVEIHSVKVMTDFGFGTQKAILDGIIEAVDKGADVINMSLGAKSYQSKEKAYEEAISYAVNAGVIVVTAAGNSSDNAELYVPANQKNVITVTSINEQNGLSYFSNYLGKVTYGISAPGENILSTIPNGEYKIKSGTSMAAPHVAGLASVLKALDPELNHTDIHRILESTGALTAATVQSGKLIQPLEAVRAVTGI